MSLLRKPAEDSLQVILRLLAESVQLGDMNFTPPAEYKTLRISELLSSFIVPGKGPPLAKVAAKHLMPKSRDAKAWPFEAARVVVWPRPLFPLNSRTPPSMSAFWLHHKLYLPSSPRGLRCAFWGWGGRRYGGVSFAHGGGLRFFKTSGPSELELAHLLIGFLILSFRKCGTPNGHAARVLLISWAAPIF